MGEPAQGESRPIVGTELDSGFIDYKPAAAVGEGISAEQFHAPNCDHVKDDLISRRRVYRMIERMAGMQVPVIDHDAFGDPFTRAAAKPAEIYAHVLKGIDQSPGGTASSQFMIEQAIEWSGKAGRLQGELDKMNREIGELRKERDALKRQLEQK